MTNAVTLYAIVKPTSWVREIPLLMAANLLLVACGYAAFPLPFSPVPVTLQSFGVLVIAMALGRTRGTAVVGAYLFEGAMGLPVFAGGNAGLAALFGPTGGYLMGFVLAACVVGSLAERGFDRSLMRTTIAMLIGKSIIFAAGLVWLARFVPSDMVLPAGLWPFLPGVAIKIAAAALLLPTVWRFVAARVGQNRP